eukprot:5800352-Prymnesium_polylepis.1
MFRNWTRKANENVPVRRWSSQSRSKEWASHLKAAVSGTQRAEYSRLVSRLVFAIKHHHLLYEVTISLPGTSHRHQGNRRKNGEA